MFVDDFSELIYGRYKKKFTLVQNRFTLPIFRFAGVSSGACTNIDVSDNGIGFDSGSLSEGNYTGDGFGLFDIREKINHLGGCVKINSVPVSGTRINLNVPLNEAALSTLKN